MSLQVKPFFYGEIMISKENIREYLEYDRDSGTFKWAKDVSIRSRKGMIAGTISSRGYVTICIHRTFYKAHNLAWLYVYGEYPKFEIDHINHIQSDNRIINLRDVTPVENARNQPKHKRNKSGVNGVSFHTATGKWRARITVNGKFISLGLYHNLDDAKNARINANRIYGFHENHGK